MNRTHKQTTIIKASGERNVFSADKLRNSLLRSGASKDVVNEIVEKIIAELYEGMPTSAIYGKAFRLLKQHKKGFAAKYKLKAAIMELGPTGFPFEQFIAKVFERLGYTTQTGKIIAGKCVTHEVDVIARKDGEESLVECKFHQQKGVFCDVKIPLYISARFRDIQDNRDRLNAKTTSHPFTGWLVTNTHFTKDAVSYGLCAGLKLMGWDLPAKDSLRELIDKYGIHPLTTLTTLTKYEKQQLLEKNIVLCSDLEHHWELLERIIHAERVIKVKEECKYLSNKKANSGIYL
ncbi:MAG: restriction endonuclease [Taibaiella sp.]|jgi:hypothetical protein